MPIAALPFLGARTALVNSACLLAGALAAIAGLAGCGPSGEAAGPVSGLRITATTGMIADAARIVAGEHATVSALMGPGVDPHLYKATQGDLKKLSQADVIFYNGLHLEGRMADVLEKMAQRVRTAPVGEAVPAEHLRKPPQFEGHPDPHVWFDPGLWRHAVARIRDTLVELDPAHRDTYERNAAAYLAELDALDAYARERLATIPVESRVLITAHDAFGYFGDAYAIEVVGLQGISTAAEYGLQDLERVIDIIVERKIKAIFAESSISPKSIEALVQGVTSRGHSVAVGGQLYSDAMGAADTPEGSYLGMVRHNVDTIVEGLR